MTVARSRNVEGRAESIRLEAACLLAIVFVFLNMLDAELRPPALSHGSIEANRLAAEFDFDLVLKTLISTAIVIPLLLIRWWRAIALLCAGMSGMVLWNTGAVLTWLRQLQVRL
ncbi:MAG: hypothetical protein ACOC9B_02655 [Chloroflexota bacterium]